MRKVLDGDVQVTGDLVPVGSDRNVGSEANPYGAVFCEELVVTSGSQSLTPDLVDNSAVLLQANIPVTFYKLGRLVMMQMGEFDLEMAGASYMFFDIGTIPGDMRPSGTIELPFKYVDVSTPKFGQAHIKPDGSILFYAQDGVDFLALAAISNPNAGVLSWLV